MLLEAETNKYCPGGNDIGAISNLITWVLDFFFECVRQITSSPNSAHEKMRCSKDSQENENDITLC
jgi:hypothetical protein